MKQSERENRIGVEFTTNEEYQVIVIDYVNYNKVQVMFLDEHKWTTWTQISHLKKGSLKNPFHKSVFGIGFLGVNENGEVPKCNINGQRTREYSCWKGMLQRCYSDKCHETRPTYENVTVCDRWHNYSLFLEDLPKIKGYEHWKNNPNQQIALNKDMYYTELGIDTDEKIYSLKTTRFISKSDNSKESVERRWKD